MLSWARTPPDSKKRRNAVDFILGYIISVTTIEYLEHGEAGLIGTASPSTAQKAPAPNPT